MTPASVLVAPASVPACDPVSFLLMPRLVSVAVPVPALDALTYRVPDGLDVPAVGARVLVPLGARRLTGSFSGARPGRRAAPHPASRSRT